MTPARRSTRSRPAKAPLSEEAVVAAGLRVLRQEGLTAVTMRRVAAELDTGPASLYVYVANRDELLHQMLDAVVATVRLEPADPARWREELAATVTRVVHALTEYPGLGRVSLGHIPTGPAWLELFDHVLGLLLAGGLSRQNAAWACDLIAMHIGAVAFETGVGAGPAETGGSGAAQDELQAALDRRHENATIEDRLTGLDPARYPYLAGCAAELSAGSADARLAFGIRVLINGFSAAP
ncbi:TetR/AcrR family transcriptional regulator [Kitasatospora sp. NPDC097643]|uniref:TetR/AcrR family transcriptional regulator n=1 Tax=Kitasatospora sp. NPDC097643 TaxID=3157230 RepID=UPI003327B6CE